MKTMNSQKQINRMLALMSKDDSVDAPPEVILWAKKLFRTRTVESKDTLFQRIVAVLNVELLPQSAVLGERSAGSSQVRQMFFQAGENGIDLRINKTSRGWKVEGQILGSGFEDASVTLSGSDQRLSMPAGEAAGFRFSNVPPGPYQLIATASDSEIIVENLDLS